MKTNQIKLGGTIEISRGEPSKKLKGEKPMYLSERSNRTEPRPKSFGAAVTMLMQREGLSFDQATAEAKRRYPELTEQYLKSIQDPRQ